jgi:hypothetical protein
MEYQTTYIVLAAAFGLFMAWGIGANDVANAMATSVGSKALTIKQAILVAAIFEFAGAVLAGGGYLVADCIEEWLARIDDPLDCWRYRRFRRRWNRCGCRAVEQSRHDRYELGCVADNGRIYCLSHLSECAEADSEPG